MNIFTTLLLLWSLVCLSLAEYDTRRSNNNIGSASGNQNEAVSGSQNNEAALENGADQSSSMTLNNVVNDDTNLNNAIETLNDNENLQADDGAYANYPYDYYGNYYDNYYYQPIPYNYYGPRYGK